MKASEFSQPSGNIRSLIEQSSSTGRMNISGFKNKNDYSIIPVESLRKVGGTDIYYHNRNLKSDMLVPPIRQTASIFKQPVTVYKPNQESVAKSDIKPTNLDKPKQIFWEKRLEGMRACSTDGNEFDSIDLGKLKPVAPFGDLVLQSVSTALHLNNNSVTGQTASKATILSNPAAFISPDQPLIYLINITDEDITRQEEVVNNARKKIQEVLKA